MNRRQAKKFAYRLAAAEIEAALAGGQWNDDQNGEQSLSDADWQRVRDALQDISEQLYRKGDDEAR